MVQFYSVFRKLSRNFVGTQTAFCETSWTGVTLSKVFRRNLSRFPWPHDIEETFHWLIPSNAASQVAGKVLHYAELKKKRSVVRSVARTDFYFSERLRQRKTARDVCRRVCTSYIGQFCTIGKLNDKVIGS